MELKSRAQGYEDNLIHDTNYYVSYRVASHGVPICLPATDTNVSAMLSKEFHSVLRELFTTESLRTMSIWGAMHNSVFHLHYMTSNRVLVPWREYYPQLTQERLGSTCVYLPSFYLGTGKYFREDRFFTGEGNLVFMHPFDFHSSYLFFDRVGYDCT